MKKIYNFLGLCAYILGSIGGFGYAMYSGAYIIGICIAVLGVMAYPTAKKWYKKIMEEA